MFGLKFKFGFGSAATPRGRLKVDDLAQSPLWSQSSQGSRISLQPKRILVVDDDPVILKTAGMKLRAAGYDVRTVADCSEAIAAVGEYKPKLILLDVNFPPEGLNGGTTAWDGFKLMAWLQNLKSAERIRFIIISSDNPETLERHRLARLAAAFFQKPLNYDCLLEAIAGELRVES
jgi:CheY-like chemotaxis protein